MPDIGEFVPLARIGQLLRQEGRTLRLDALNRVIRTGEVGARRCGGRWAVKVADARTYSRPLVPDAC